MKQIYEFWINWKNKTDVEKRAIDSLIRALDFLLLNIPKNKIISVYVKGSFVTREMSEKSDVDIIPILKDNIALNKLKTVRNKNKEILKPAEFLPLSLAELKRNKSVPHSRRNVFLRDLEHYKLIYGKKLINSTYPTKNLREMFLDELTVLKNKSIPLYKEGKFGFSQLIKQVFWITYSEQKMIGKSSPRTWKGLNSFVKNKNHIIHETYKLRLHPTKNKAIRKRFLMKLKDYLKKLEDVK